MSAKNAIEVEIDKIEDQWEAFVTLKQPILRWVVTPGANQLVSTFIQLQEHASDKVADFFFPLYSPLDSSAQYGEALLSEIDGRMLASKETVEAAAPGTYRWTAPDTSFVQNAAQALLLCGLEILNGYGKGFENLVFVLRPSKVSSIGVWQNALLQVIQLAVTDECWPVQLKVVVFDYQQHPTLSELADKTQPVMTSMVPEVDLNLAMTKVFDAADDGSDGAVYRKHYVAMISATETNDIELVEQNASFAMEIAGKNRWYELWVATLLLKATAYMNNQMQESAIEDYRHAQRFAQMGQEDGVKGCEKLWLQSLLSEAGAWLFLKEYLEAAELYRQSAELAERFEDAFFEMDSWRMVSYCQEKQKMMQQAWESSLASLNAAEKLEADMRPNSTLPFVGEALMRLAPDRQAKSIANEKLTEYLGVDWLDMLPSQENNEGVPC